MVSNPFAGNKGNLKHAADGLEQLVKQLSGAEERSKKHVEVSYDAPFRYLAEANVDPGLTREISTSVDTSRKAAQAAVHQLKERAEAMLKKQIYILRTTSNGN